jgi:hypothetical protein
VTRLKKPISTKSRPAPFAAYHAWPAERSSESASRACWKGSDSDTHRDPSLLPVPPRRDCRRSNVENSPFRHAPVKGETATFRGVQRCDSPCTSRSRRFEVGVARGNLCRCSCTALSPGRSAKVSLPSWTSRRVYRSLENAGRSSGMISRGADGAALSEHDRVHA